jgi:hypothetical protein
VTESPAKFNEKKSKFPFRNKVGLNCRENERVQLFHDVTIAKIVRTANFFEHSVEEGTPEGE